MREIENKKGRVFENWKQLTGQDKKKILQKNFGPKIGDPTIWEILYVEELLEDETKTEQKRQTKDRREVWDKIKILNTLKKKDFFQLQSMLKHVKEMACALRKKKDERKNMDEKHAIEEQAP